MQPALVRDNTEQWHLPHDEQEGHLSKDKDQPDDLARLLLVIP